MNLTTAVLYLLAIASLFGSVIAVLSKDPRSLANRYYGLAGGALLGWVGTLFVYDSLTSTPALLTIGRLNFALIAIAAPAGYCLVKALAGQPIRLSLWLWIETLGLTVLTSISPLIDQAERIVDGQHTTDFGLLAPLYVLHVVYYLIGLCLVAFQPGPSVAPQAKAQLRLVGIGVTLAAAVGLVTNLALPYLYGDFHFINIGPLATLAFMACIGYAIVRAGLFHIRIILKGTLIVAAIVGLTLELYSLAVSFLSALLPLSNVADSRLAATAVALIVNAFTQNPIRHALERLIDRLLHTDQPRVIRQSPRKVV